MKIYVDIGATTWGCPAVEFHWNVFQIRNVGVGGWLTGLSTTLHWAMLSGCMLCLRCSTKLSHCNNGRCHLAWPGPSVPLLPHLHLQVWAGCKNQTQLKVTGEWDMRNLCEVIEQPVWETSNQRKLKNSAKAYQLKLKKLENDYNFWKWENKSWNWKNNIKWRKPNVLRDKIPSK